MQDLYNMVADSPSVDLTPCTGAAKQLFTPEITKHHYNTTDNKNLNDLLDSHGFSAPGKDYLHLFTPDRTKPNSSMSQTYELASPREVKAFLSSRSFCENTTGNSPFRNSTPGDSHPNQAFSDPNLTTKPLGVFSNSGGRPTNHTQNLLNICFQGLDDLLHKTVVETGRSQENLINLWLQRQASTRQIKSGWNKYQ